MFIQDLYLLAYDCAEIRTPLLCLKKEIFRKGFETWHPKFVVKCEKCDLEFQSEEEAEEHRDHGLKKPDISQIKEFDKKWRHNCNIFGQDLESVLNECLVPGTKILTRKGKNNFCYQNVEDVCVGTKVWTHNGRLKPVIETMSREVDEDLVVLYLSNDEVIKLTGNHSVYTKAGWKRADKLVLDDILMTFKEGHPTWIDNHKKAAKHEAPFNRHPRSIESIEAQKETVKYRREVLGVEYHSNQGYIPHNKGKINKEYYGEDKAKEISNKISSSLVGKYSGDKNSMFGVSRPGVGFYFRAKVGTFKGEKNPNWKNGASFELYGIVFTKELKRKIFVRDNSICQICGANRLWKKLDCHHIDYDKQNNDETNLISLCPTCHTKTNFNRDYWKDLLSPKVFEKYGGVCNGTKILKIDREHYKGLVYNCEVEDDHSYAGRGLIFHNCEDDANIVDDSFIHLNKQYRRTADNRFLSQLTEIRRIHPALMEFDLDKNGLPKNSHWLCPFHREEVKPAPGRCSHPDCKEDMIPAMYVYNHRGNRVYLYEEELLHESKFSPSTTYGYSPILTIMQKVLTISGMDRFLYRYFFERKTPTQMILTNTDDPQSLEVERARMEAKMMDDPTYTPWIAVSNRTGRGRTDVVRLFHTLHEMDYLRIREEIRDRVAGIYGVPQMFYNVMEGLGGISGQTQQLKMMSNVVASDQRMFNEKIVPTILRALGITDWIIALRTPEEKVEGQVLQLAQQKVQIATQMRGMGFDIKLKPTAWDIDTLDFSFSGKAMSLQEQQQMGMPFGGMPVDMPMEGGEEGAMEEPPEEEQELGKDQEEHAPRRHRLEEIHHYSPTPDEEEEEEKDSYESRVY
jgi:hypothetical protein